MQRREKNVKLHFLDGRSKGGYVTFGVPWKKGETKPADAFSLLDADGRELCAQSRVTAYWPDGSTKWTAHTALIDTDTAELIKKETPYTGGNITGESDKMITVNNGLFETEFYKSGNIIMETPYGTTRLKAIKEHVSEEDGIERRVAIPYYGEVETAEIEDNGPLKTVVKVTGRHMRGGEGFLRFAVRFMLFNNSNEIKILHTFLYDADQSADFIKGVGIETSRKTSGAVYNRRVKITGDYGVFHETMQLLNVWRPKIGTDYYKAQLAGDILALDENDEKIKATLDDIATWDSYKLIQTSPDSFEVKKRTANKCCSWVKANFGHRSKGLMYMADDKGGIAVAMRDFWQKYPSALEVSGLSTDEAVIMAWIVTPDCEAFDMRHYDTKAHSQAYYEGFDEIGCQAYGIACTNELSMFVSDTVISDSQLMDMADRVQKPPVMLCDIEYYHDGRALGKGSRT